MASTTASTVLSVPPADKLEEIGDGTLEGYGKVDDLLSCLRMIDEFHNPPPDLVPFGSPDEVQTPTVSDLGALFALAESLDGTARMFSDAASEIRGRLKVLDEIRRDRA